MSNLEYWRECISNSAESCGLSVTTEQLDALAGDVASSHDMYSEYSGSPGWGDRLAEIEAGYKKKLADAEREFDKYREASETAVRRALKIHPEDRVVIDKDGFVNRLR